MESSLTIEHFTSCSEGYLLKRKFLDWRMMIVDLHKKGEIGYNSFKKHLTRNYAVGMLSLPKRNEFFYSTCQIKNDNAKHHLDLIIKKHTNSQWNSMIDALCISSDAFLYSYIEVDRSRGIRTKVSCCRKHDSESVILESMTKYMFHHRIFDGEVFIYTQKEPCLNCDLVIQQFMHRHPLINVTLFYNQVNYIDLSSKYHWLFRKERG
nr:deaminase domain-containing protein [Paenibacillus xylanexedens]